MANGSTRGLDRATVADLRRATKGAHYFKPTIPTPSTRLEFLEERQTSLLSYAASINTKALPRRLAIELRESKQWINAGVRQARGKDVSVSNLPLIELPSEGVVIATSFERAQGVTDLITHCNAFLGSKEPI